MKISTLLRGLRPAQIGAWTLIAASTMLGAYYGFLLGHGAGVGLVFGLGAVGGELVKPHAVAHAFEYLSTKRWGRGAVATVLAVACLAYSFTAELKFVATTQGDDMAARQTVADDVAKSRASRDALAASLAAIPTPEQAKGWQTIVDAKLASPKAGGCVKDDGPYTKANCPLVRELKGKIAEAERRPAIEAEIARLDTELSKQRVVGAADPAAAAIATYSLGKWEADQVSPWLLVIPVLFIEIGSAFGLLLSGWSTPVPQVEGNAATTPFHAVPDVHGTSDQDTGQSKGAEIVNFLKAQGGQFRGGQGRIAERLGMSKTTVNRKLRELRSEGLLVTEEAKGATVFKLA